MCILILINIMVEISKYYNLKIYVNKGLYCIS